MAELILGAIGGADVALRSIKELYNILESIRTAPQAIKAIQQELDLVRGPLEFLKSALCTRSAAGAHIVAFKTAVGSYADDCDQLRQDLKSWTRHSSKDKTSFRDRMRVGFLSQGKIDAFITRLQENKQTIVFVLACDEFAQRVDSQKHKKQFQSDLVLREQQVANQASNTVQKIAVVEDRMKKLPENGRDSSTDMSDADDLRREYRILQTHHEICRQEMSRLQMWCREQNIDGISMDGNSKVAAGVLNSGLKDLSVKQNINQVSATGGSKGIVGIAEKVNLGDFFT